MNPLLVRQVATARTIDRFRQAPHAWGTADCWQMARFHLRGMKVKLPRCRAYKSAIGAKRALREMGFDTLEGLLDSFLLRIAPAEALLGDIVLMQGDALFDAITISVGEKVIGWHQEDMSRLSNIMPIETIGAWRAI
ncbi:hypothetical protein [Sphingosinicella sp. BN140058]|uniref:DUF6950 family protein n=1 Tax=Sphingosinicella sp. BN140058 TaxID=1892855 RepID=UPI0010118D7D|nr:hypothetical protein [Sphingosinicella sp. BN140058]QAY77929.1 hypothetical protein ETR14_16415 [Sphingosinicella sp. BN140058]